MANIGFSQRRTLFYLYGWTLALALLALALRFVPYSDDRGNFDPFWSVVMGLCIVAALAASIYVIYVLEILKLRRLRLRQATGRDASVEAEVDEAVERELETGEFEPVDPDDADKLKPLG
jgi:UDP-GlcNAc:undecaprenyl-phosphate GlcNAc-1-phosphate transferase